jgi:hypothetical protein
MRHFESSGSIAYFPDSEPCEQLKQQLAQRWNQRDKRAILPQQTKMVEFIQVCDLAIWIRNILTKKHDRLKLRLAQQRRFTGA